MRITLRRTGTRQRAYATPEEVAWLREQLDRNRLSQRGIAHAIGLVPSSLSRSLDGKRKMRGEEFAAALAEVEAVAPVASLNPLGRVVWQHRLTNTALAEMTGLEFQRAANIVAGRGAPPTVEEAQALSRALGLSSEEIVRPVIVLDKTRPAGPARDPVHRTRRSSGDDIPILAALKSAGGGYFSAVKEIVEYQPRPPFLTNVPGAFGIFVDTMMLAPRYMPGEILYVHPGRPPRVGSWVMAELKRDAIVFGEVVERNSGTIRLRNPGAALPDLSFEDIVTIGAIVGTWSG